MRNKQKLLRSLNRIFKRLLAFLLTVGFPLTVAFSHRGYWNSQGKFRMDFARQKGFANCWQPLQNFRKSDMGLRNFRKVFVGLQKFSQSGFGVVIFSQGTCGGVKFSQGICGVAKFSQGIYGVVKFSQDAYGVAKIFACPAKCFIFPLFWNFPAFDHQKLN